MRAPAFRFDNGQQVNAAGRRRGLVLALLAAGLFFACLAGMCMGAVRVPLSEILAAVGGQAASPQFEAVFWHLRVPRVLLGLLVGGSLAVAGAVLQGLFRNPLADPALVGISSGGAMGAVFVIVIAGALAPGASTFSDLRMLPFGAFLGALATTLFVQRLASWGGYTDVAVLLLVGVAVNSLAGTVIGIGTYLSTEAQLRSLAFWTLGSLGAASWPAVGMIAPFAIALIMLAPFSAKVLNALALGEAEAGHLGFSVEKAKVLLIVLSAAGVGASVALTGIIAFVGLVVPHLVRLLVGPDHRFLLPAAALAGAAILIASDTVARTIVAPAELPIGILTAGFGAPFLLLLLLHQRRSVLWN